MASELAMRKAVRAWTTEETRHIAMDEKLVKAFEDILDKYIDALIWSSGSADFAEGGQAREGWLKICQPLLNS